MSILMPEPILCLSASYSDWLTVSSSRRQIRAVIICRCRIVLVVMLLWSKSGYIYEDRVKNNRFFFQFLLFSSSEQEFTHAAEKSAVISKIFPVILYPVYLYIPWSKSMMFKFLIKTLVTLIACSVKPRVHHHKGHIFPWNCISTITITTYMMLTLSWPAHDWRKKIERSVCRQTS